MPTTHVAGIIASRKVAHLNPSNASCDPSLNQVWCSSLKMSNLDPTPSRVPRRPAPVVPTSVYMKLLFFSTALFAAPLAVYYGAKDRYLGGNATYAGGLAAIAANVVLIGYVVAAILEDDGTGGELKQKDIEKEREQLESRKDR